MGKDDICMKSVCKESPELDEKSTRLQRDENAFKTLCLLLPCWDEIQNLTTTVSPTSTTEQQPQPPKCFPSAYSVTWHYSFSTEELMLMEETTTTRLHWLVLTVSVRVSLSLSPSLSSSLPPSFSLLSQQSASPALRMCLTNSAGPYVPWPSSSSPGLTQKFLHSFTHNSQNLPANAQIFFSLNKLVQHVHSEQNSELCWIIELTSMQPCTCVGSAFPPLCLFFSRAGIPASICEAELSPLS